eukprot:COSAG06_NODE_19859_length_819_cov_1.795833_1_plen_123_part_01
MPVKSSDSPPVLQDERRLPDPVLPAGGARRAYDRWLMGGNAGSRPFQRSLPPGHEGPVTGVSFSPDGRTLASCSGDKTIMLWDMGAEDPAVAGGPRVLKGHEDVVSGVSFSPDGRTLASCSDD